MKRRREAAPHGNYKHYYGYREDGPSVSSDPRFAVLRWEEEPATPRAPRYRLATATASTTPNALNLRREEWFHEKKCLDIGCNDGSLTTEVARRFGCRYMLGLDIDAALVAAARRVSRARAEAALQEPSIGSRGVGERGGEGDDGWGEPSRRPASADDDRGAAWVSRFRDSRLFFRREDFAQDAHNDGGYDVISCFSVSKWMHLNHGDEGLRAVFFKVHSLLKAGGCFILEPQPWSSYRKNKDSSEAARTNLADIAMRPEAFVDFLTGTVGLARCEALGAPSTAPDAAAALQAAGVGAAGAGARRAGVFQARPVYVLWK